MGQMHRMWSGTNNPAGQGRAKSIKNISNEFQVEVTGETHTVSSRIWRHMNERGLALQFGRSNLGVMTKLVVVQSLSRVWLFAAAYTVARQASLSITISRSLLKLMSIDQWCHPAISSSVVPFSSCLQAFPASGSFPMSWLFPWGGQRTGASASASVFPINIQGWFPLGLTGLRD